MPQSCTPYALSYHIVFNKYVPNWLRYSLGQPTLLILILPHLHSKAGVHVRDCFLGSLLPPPYKRSHTITTTTTTSSLVINLLFHCSTKSNILLRLPEKGEYICIQTNITSLHLDTYSEQQQQQQHVSTFLPIFEPLAIVVLHL